MIKRNKCIFLLMSFSFLCGFSPAQQGNTKPEKNNVLAKIKIEDHPVLSNCDIDSMPFIGARDINLPEDSLVIVETSEHVPLIYRVRQGQRVAIVINMDTVESEFYYSAWFPVVVYNCARYLMGRQDTIASACSIGDSISIPTTQYGNETTAVTIGHSNEPILGYAEESLVQALDITVGQEPVILDCEPNLRILPSPYLTGDIRVEPGQGRVRLETKRGCLHNCNFCAHKDLQRHKVYIHELSRVYEDLSYLNNLRVKKINIVDPSFNQGPTYRAVLHRCVEIGLQARIALQVYFEDIKGKEGDEFLDLCSSLDIVLEFGLQTIVENEMRQINRINDLNHVQKIMKILNQQDIPYEVSLIYGLPDQTFESFRESVVFLLDKGCTVVKSFPLKLLKGTALWLAGDTGGMVQTPEGRFQVPVVTKNDSFGRDEWEQMRSLSKSVRRVTQRMWRSSRTADGKRLLPTTT